MGTNFYHAIDLLFKTNEVNDRLRDQYIIPNIDNNNNPHKLCAKLKELSLYRIYPLLIQWKSFEDQENFQTNCPMLLHQPQFVHKINKYDKNKSIPNSINCSI